MPRRCFTPLSLKRKIEKARAARDRAYDAIAKPAIDQGLGHLPFNECRKRFAPKLGEALDAANRHLAEIEAEAVHKGQAWRGTFNLLHFYN